MSTIVIVTLYWSDSGHWSDTTSQAEVDRRGHFVAFVGVVPQTMVRQIGMEVDLARRHAA